MLAGLLASQSEYDSDSTALETQRQQLAPSAYFQQQYALATALTDAGGRRQAAMAFSNSVLFRAEGLSANEFIEYSLTAAELLLTDDLARLAANHLHEADARKSANTPPDVLGRLRRLQIRCFAELCAYSQLLGVIEEELPHADAKSRERLEAERDEIRWLQGEFSTPPSSGGHS